MAIQSFSDKHTEDFFINGKIQKKVKWKGVAKIALRKLDMLHYAANLNDLRSPPNNRLEKLKRELKSFHSIRINDQWRIIFKWTELGPGEVKITDYH